MKTHGNTWLNPQNPRLPRSWPTSLWAIPTSRPSRHRAQPTLPGRPHTAWLHVQPGPEIQLQGRVTAQWGFQPCLSAAPATPARAHIVRPRVKPSEALRVSAADTLDVHLQDQFKPWPQQGKHLFPVPVGLIRIKDLARNVMGGVGEAET